ncbi:CST complex subunit CTC1 [Aulostomus maculatus]
MEAPPWFRDQLRPASEAESTWLRNVFSFIRQQVCPVLSGPAPPAAETGRSSNQLLGNWSKLSQCVQADECASHLSVSVLKTIQENTPATDTLPVSYRLLSISELLSQQHLACVSNLSWNTNQQRAWAREAELCLPGQRPLPRVNMLLIGCLEEVGGEWRLTDASGSVRCELLSPSPLWRDRPVFLPHWNYIPHSAPGREHEEARGFVEMVTPPVLLSPGPQRGLATDPVGGAEPTRAICIREATTFLYNRGPGSRIRGRRVSVCGRVLSVCPLLIVAGTTFFCFSLTDDTHTLPVLVKETSRLWWARCVCVDQSVCVTALRVCVLRGWRGNNILCATERSEIHNTTAQTTADGDAQAGSQSDTPPPLMTPCAAADDDDDDDDNDAPVEAEPGRHVVQPGFRIKRSRVISYQGTVTAVVSQGAGLYVIDRKVGLCLAYQPMTRRTLRAGDVVELYHVHFLYRPCPDFPPSMLCTCLRSTLRVTSFSRVVGSPPDSSCPADGVLPRLLLENNRGVSAYLWACHLNSQLQCSLVPSVLKQQCVCVLSWKLMECVLRPRRRGQRDIYSEMLDEPHTCPVTQYSADAAVPQYVSVLELTQLLQSNCWSSLSLSSLLPPGGPGLTSAQINAALAWSSRTVTSDPQDEESRRERPLMLVGVLELPSRTFEHTLQLRDRTGVIACVVTETSEELERGQTAVFNTAWIGCLVCVQHFTMATERFLQSDFPSYQHLDQDKFITHKHCRVYLQFSLDHIHILSPSVAMVTHLRHRGEEEKNEGGPLAGTKRRKESGSSHSTPSITMDTSRACVSMVIRVEEKEGVTWMNTGAGFKEKEAALTPSFSVRAAVIGPVVNWWCDPQNGPMTDREKGEEVKVKLVCSGVSARWFPLLQPGCFYRLAVNTHDRSVLIGCGVSGQSVVELHTDSTLEVQSDWRFHTLTRPLLLHDYQQPVSPSVWTVSQVLDCSSADLVCFYGLVSDRISQNDRMSTTAHQHTGVRLTMCDQSGRSLQVYLNLSHTPYPPGLLPGNTLLLSAFQRRLSKSGSVYCRYLPVSSVSVMSLGDKSSAEPPPAPIMHLGLWAQDSQSSCAVGRVKGHVVCFLLLQLQWCCSLCGSVYTQSVCPHRCHSSSAVFQSTAKLVIDDGTGEAHVWFSGSLVGPLLGLADSQWEGLQRALRVRGHIRVYLQGRSLVCDSDTDDSLLHFLLCVCSRDAACRLLSLTCRKHNTQKPEEMRRFSRGERDFMTRMTPPLQLTCLHIHGCH